jgi:iron complex transport system ATP-binding protein
LTGTLRPSRGAALLDGRPLSAWPQRLLARRRAVLAQSQQVAFPFTVFEVVALGQTGRSLSSPQARRQILECLAAVDLAGYEGRFFQQLSGGEQQRVHIARVLCQLDTAAEAPQAGARWLFLDEPTQSLDIAHQLVVLDLARRHVASGGGALAILHDLNLASLYADRLIIVERGRIVADGMPQAVLTEERIRAVFGERLRIVRDGPDARPSILPSLGA